MGPWGSLVSLLVWDRPTAVQICAAPFAGVVQSGITLRCQRSDPSSNLGTRIHNMELLEISQEDARKSKGVYLDVRRKNERDRGHVEKDIHIPESLVL